MPTILSLNPHSLSDILEDIARVGAATGRERALPTRWSAICAGASMASGSANPDYRPRVVCLEWFEPLYVAGHWVPEMVTLAGGFDPLGRKGEPSFKIEWQNVIDAKPDVILLMPCGFDMRRTVKESAPLRSREGWNELPAVKTGNVYALNGNAYFSRPGPRLVNGLEILARIIHPEQVGWSLAPTEAAKIN